MHTAYLVVTIIAVALDGFSGVSALLHFAPIIPPMRRAGVPLSWLRFPIGTLKTLGALGLVVGLWVPAIGIAAAAGLTIFFVCAMYTHVLANDISGQFVFAGFLLTLNAATFALTLTAHAAAV
ncbi:DoxX family protein [Mycobacterium paraffinicum]|uniref:DoxX family protein n=1 Tax=Mycobacterium paraffinicum TaxID=53378 RepID=A0ABP8RRF5_9MYCO|nr:DoxX family protein [Mycobacterium paraffinicum]MCV7309519.1 DoxX family protein [Mycobacterium paraffinicum]